MTGIYIYSDKASIASELISFAKKTGSAAFVIALSGKAAEELKNSGADKIYYFQGNSLLPESYSKAIAEFLKKQGAELFAVGATTRGRDIAARVAGYLDCGMVSDVSSLSSSS